MILERAGFEACGSRAAVDASMNSRVLVLVVALLGGVAAALRCGGCTGRCRSPRHGRAVDRARHAAARDRAGLGPGRRADVAAAALRVVPLVGQARQIRAGSYEIERGMTPRACSTRWCAATRRSPPCASIEGWTFRQVRAELAQRRTLKPPTATHERCRADGRARRARRLAGRALLPRHLRLQQGRRATSRVLKRAYRAMQRRLDAAWAERAPDTPLKSARRGADAGLDRREGDRRRGRPRPGRRRVRQPAAHRHAAADRPDRDLRPRRGASTAICASATCSPTRRTTPTCAPACRRRRSRCRARRRCSPRCSRSRRKALYFVVARRRQQRVQRDARRAQSRGEPVPAPGRPTP